jgi:hypothetical protein
VRAVGERGAYAPAVTKLLEALDARLDTDGALGEAVLDLLRVRARVRVRVRVRARIWARARVRVRVRVRLKG